DEAGTDPRYTGAFREYGIDVEALGEAAALVQRSAIRAHLVAELDYWASVLVKDGQEETRQKARQLLAVSRAVDPATRGRIGCERWCFRGILRSWSKWPGRCLSRNYPQPRWDCSEIGWRDEPRHRGRWWSFCGVPSAVSRLTSGSTTTSPWRSRKYSRRS